MKKPEAALKMVGIEHLRNLPLHKDKRR